MSRGNQEGRTVRQGNFGFFNNPHYLIEDLCADGSGWILSTNEGAAPLRLGMFIPRHGDQPNGDRLAREFSSRLLVELTQEGLSRAAAHALDWLREGVLPHHADHKAVFECMAPVRARSATRFHDIDAAFYVDGVVIAILLEDDSLEEAQEKAERIEESCPAWFVTAALVVALGRDGRYSITAPGQVGERWQGLDEDVLRFLLSPRVLVRFARYDIGSREVEGRMQREFLLPDTVMAVELAFARALEPSDGLVSIAEGAGSFAAVRSLAHRLLEAEIQPIVLVANHDVHAQFMRDLQHISVPDTLEGLESGRMVVARVSRLAHLWDYAGALAPRPRAVLAFGVDAGFRGEQGFAVRQLMPQTPWISFTSLPVWGLSPGVFHAFADPRDEEGMLAVADTTVGRVPICEERRRVFNGTDIDLIESVSSIVLFHMPPAPRSTSLVLLSNASEAEALTRMLEQSEVMVHNATEWGQSNEGWRLLENPPRSLVVVRTSLPFWVSLPQLNAVFVARNVGPTTIARLRNMLGRSAPGKESAFLFLGSEFINESNMNYFVV